jgi:molybdopterin/thiamine biosynthesis adenylyltransferase
MSKTSSWRDRFQRQILLPEVGVEGQIKLKNSKVFILGSGGLASSAAFYLTAAGIGVIGIADEDKVDVSNLNRQILHDTSKIGMPKVISARQTLQKLDPDVEIETYPFRLTSTQEIVEIMDKYDVAVDCSDNYITRYNINDACIQIGKPWVYGAVDGFEGQAMTVMPGNGPCYRCLYPSASLKSAGISPIIGITPGIIGLIQAAETIKLILETGSPLVGRLLFVDLLEIIVTEFKVSRNKNCSSCGKYQ